DGMLFVERYADAPGLSDARDVRVLESALHQSDDLIAAALRLDEVRVALVVLQQPVAELRQGEEVARLAAAHQRRLVDRTKAARLLGLGFGLERLAALAVPALVLALVDVAVVVHLLDELPATGVVARLARLDEVVVTDLQCAPDLLELAGHVVAVRLRI